MKKLVVLLLLSLSLPALACFDKGAQKLNNKQIQVYAQYEGFMACLEKLEVLGVDLNKVSGARKDRADEDDGPVIYTLMAQGKDANGKTVRIYANYDIQKKNFVCKEPTYILPKCF